MVKVLLRREITRQAMVFVLIGLTSTVLNYLIFLIFFAIFSINYLLSAGIGFMAGVVFGFGFNKTLTFSSNEKINKSLPKYFLVYLISLIFNITLLKIFVDLLNLNPIFANFILLPILTIINFFGTKIIAFKNSKW